MENQAEASGCAVCGQPTAQEGAFCEKCSKLSPAQALGRRPSGVTALSVFGLVTGGLSCLAGLAGLAALPYRGFEGFLYIVFGAFVFVAARSLRTMTPEGRTIQLAASVFGLCSIPFGTVYWALSLGYLTRPAAKLLFSGKTLAGLTAADWHAIQRFAASRFNRVVVAAAILAPIATIALIAAIAVPAFLRARDLAAEVGARGEVRTLHSAERQYAGMNQGFYDSLACLNRPEDCIPDYSAPITGLYGPSSRRIEGYSFRFVAGEALPPEEAQQRRISKSSLRGYAFIAVPEREQLPAFCIDDRGDLCRWPVGVAPELAEPRCPDSCVPDGF